MQDLFDRQVLIRRKCRAAAKSPSADFLMRRAADELAERLVPIERRFERAVSLFSATGHAAAALAGSGKVGRITRIEADPLLLGKDEGLVEEGERIPLAPQSVDLVVCLHALHAVNDLPGLLAGILRALRPDGLFIGALAGAGTLAELRQSLLHAELAQTGGAAARVYPFVELRDAGALLQQAGFALPVADVEPVTVRYASMLALMGDLRAMGETSALLARSRRPASATMLAAAAQYYESHFADPDGRIRASFNTIWMTGWAPDPSQQKPLRPGSARTSLARTLRDLEKGKEG